MMGMVVPETCWAYKKYSKIISGMYLVFILQLLSVLFTWHLMLYAVTRGLGTVTDHELEVCKQKQFTGPGLGTVTPCFHSSACLFLEIGKHSLSFLQGRTLQFPFVYVDTFP